MTTSHSEQAIPATGRDPLRSPRGKGELVVFLTRHGLLQTVAACVADKNMDALNLLRTNGKNVLPPKTPGNEQSPIEFLEQLRGLDSLQILTITSTILRSIQG